MDQRTMRVIADPDQWARCSHESTALSDDRGVELAWRAPDPPQDCGPVGEPDGLAFDRWCRAYRSRSLDGRVDALGSAGEHSSACGPGALHLPRGLAVDNQQRLYVAESGRHAVHVIDLWGQRLLRRIVVGGAQHPRQRPVDCAPLDCGALVLLARPAALVRIEGRRGPLHGPQLRRPRCARGLTPSRVTTHGADILVLWTGGDDGRSVLADPTGHRTTVLRHATDVELLPDGVVVVAQLPGMEFRRLRLAPWDGTGIPGMAVELEPWAARGYDGGAIARSPDGQVAYTTETGWDWVGGSGAARQDAGRVVTYRLDSGAYRTRWGRVFVDACLPRGTDIRVGFITSDDDVVADPVGRSAPENGAPAIRRPELTPPLASLSDLRRMEEPAPLFRRDEGPEWPWSPSTSDDAFHTYEAPVTAAPGRYLWLVIDLSGTMRTTPRVRALRVEAPGHGLLGLLPRSFSRDEAQADFLQRYLAPAEGMLSDLDARAALRSILVDPDATPREALAWLADFVGLVLDRRWPELARRTLVAQAFDLFRVRGTGQCLERIIGTYVGRDVIVVENWRLRGLAGTVLGAPWDGAEAPSVKGALRNAGQLGTFTLGGTVPSATGYSATAHRFTVVIPSVLDDEQRAVVRSIVEQHKPAHTMVDICELGDGMRVGRSTRLDLTSWVGPDTGWGPAVVGQVLVGADGVIGQPALGSRIGDATLGEGVRVG